VKTLERQLRHSNAERWNDKYGSVEQRIRKIFFMQNKTLKQLILRARGISEAEKYFAYTLENPQILVETARELMQITSPTAGFCTFLSASWAGFLQERYSIPAIVVAAGDLKIKGSTIFRCKKNLPEASKSGKTIAGKWDGHCWIQVDNFIGDLSIFRTAYSLTQPNILTDYIISNFGMGRGAMLGRNNELPEGMQYIPKFVLNDNQVNGLINGMGHILERNW
jgi:hypothetical protein